jgi:cytochrome c biogenesis protein CcdA
MNISFDPRNVYRGPITTFIGAGISAGIVPDKLPETPEEWARFIAAIIVLILGAFLKINTDK